MQPNDRDKVAQFLGQLMGGAAELGMAAMPLISLYKQAKQEGVDFWGLVLSHPHYCDQVVVALRKHAAKLPDSVVVGLRAVLQANQEARILKQQEDAKAREAQAHRAAPAGPSDMSV